MDICDLSAVELALALRRGELSAADVLEAVLHRADEIADTVNPFSARLDTVARRAARAADDALARGDGGPLCGIPVSTKDSHWTAGIESTSGSRTRVGFVPTETIGAIVALEAAGAVVFARTTVPEFCYFGVTESDLYGRTSNPWNLGYTAGGSSGGAAAAVAASCGPLSLGGDGGGSIRLPAAFCGVVGFKPTFGLVPHEPSTAGWKTLVAVGPLARTVADARLLLGAVAGFDPRDRHSLPGVPLDADPPEPGALRVAVSEDLGFAALDDDVRAAFRTAVDRLSDAGVQIVDATPGLSSSVHTWSAIALAEAYFSEQDEYLKKLARKAGLGDDLVVQLPYGDSGKTTFFIRSKADWERYAAKDPLHTHELKVMKRIDHRAIAVEAVLTRHGTLVGPLMNDITGHPELTPYRGGWAGNDYPATLTDEQKRRARDMTGRLGDRLAAEGYRGFFEVDYLVDLNSDELYLGGLNPRISGISSMTNVTAGAYADLPLFLFHLLEYLDVDYTVDIDEINERWSREAAVDVWSQIIIKETDDRVELLTQAPHTGIYSLGPDGAVSFRRWGNDWHGIHNRSEAFYLRIHAPGDYRYPGADLGALVTRGRLQTDDNRLEDRCKDWITGMRGQFAGTPLTPNEPPPVGPLAFKMA